MYSYIKGVLTVLKNDYAVIEAGGVGYKLNISMSTCSRLSKYLQKETVLHTYLNVREDALELYGFSTESEQVLFRHLISVSGVGPKVAISVLSTLSPESFAIALANNDARAISQSPGVGLKTAQKIIIELKDKIAKEFGAAELEGIPSVQKATPLSAVVDTLSVYGFSRAQITQAMAGVDTNQPVEEIIRQTLKVLGSK